MAKNREIGWVTRYPSRGTYLPSRPRVCLRIRKPEVDGKVKTGEYKHEQQPLMEKLKLLMLFNPLMECGLLSHWPPTHA